MSLTSMSNISAHRSTPQNFVEFPSLKTKIKQIHRKLSIKIFLVTTLAFINEHLTDTMSQYQCTHCTDTIELRYFT